MEQAGSARGHLPRLRQAPRFYFRSPPSSWCRARSRCRAAAHTHRHRVQQRRNLHPQLRRHERYPGRQQRPQPTRLRRARVQRSDDGTFIVRTGRLESSPAPPVGPAPPSERDEIEAGIKAELGNFTTLNFNQVSSIISSAIVWDSPIAVMFAAIAILVYISLPSAMCRSLTATASRPSSPRCTTQSSSSGRLLDPRQAVRNGDRQLVHHRYPYRHRL